MRRARGGSLVLAAIVLMIVGVVLRWDLIDWLIDATGFILIVIGAVMGIIGLIQLFTGGGRGSQSSDW